MSKRTRSIIEIIKSTNDIELLIYIGERFPQLKKAIYGRILKIKEN